MKRSFLILACALPILAGCGVFEDTVYIEGSAEAAQPSQYFTPAYTDDGETDMIDHLFGDGLTGFVGNSDGTVSEVQVRFDDDEELVYVSIGGGEEVVYDDVYDDEDWLEVANDAAQYAYIELYGYGANEIELYDEETGAESDGYFGIETASDALPTETATYHGYWDAYGETDSTEIGAGSHMSLAVGFASGNITGYTEGGFDAWNDDTETYAEGSFFGGISGSVEGSRIAGTMSVDGDASGEFDLMGAIYGEDAEVAAGGVGGSLSTDAGEMDLGGSFWLYQEEGEGCREC